MSQNHKTTALFSRSFQFELLFLGGAKTQRIFEREYGIRTFLINYCKITNLWFPILRVLPCGLSGIRWQFDQQGRTLCSLHLFYFQLFGLAVHS